MLALVAVLLLVLFLSAGTFAWPMAWVYVIITVVMTIGSRLLLLRRNPDLAAERAAYAEKQDASILSGGSHRRAGRSRRTLTCG